jgi:lactate dehydrogenase-like 2-hydroxyacid dehydrogenase
MVNIAIVNSSSFGKIFPEHLKALARLGKVKRFDLSPKIKGRELGRLVKGFQAVIAGVNPDYCAGFFKQTTGCLRLITRHGIGYNNVDVQAASDSGVLVTKVPGKVEREAMAEHVFALVLSCLRRLDSARMAVRRGRWMDRPSFVGTEIKNKVLGIVGIGNIGTGVAAIAKKGFGAKVVACDPYLTLSVIRKRGAQPIGFRRLLQTADIISLNCSLNKRNFHLFNRSVLAQMKRGAVLVNTARGELVEEKSLIHALSSGKLTAYACDVVEGEPITNPKHPLLRLENALVVPHIGAYTRESLRAMGEKVVQDVKDILQGRRPKEIVNPISPQSSLLRS